MTAPVDGARSALAPATWHKSLRLRYEINEFQQMFILQCMHARLGPNYLQVEKDWGRIRHWQLRLHVKGDGAGLSLLIGGLGSESKRGHAGIAVGDRLPLHCWTGQSSQSRRSCTSWISARPELAQDRSNITTWIYT